MKNKKQIERLIEDAKKEIKGIMLEVPEKAKNELEKREKKREKAKIKPKENKNEIIENKKSDDININCELKKGLKCRVICERLAVRCEPSQSSYIQYLLEKNQIIYLDEYKDINWYKIIGESSYVMRKFIEVIK